MLAEAFEWLIEIGRELTKTDAFRWLMTIVVAWFFGEKAAVRYERDKEKREQIAAHQALLNQVKLIKKLAQNNIVRSEAPKNYDSLIKLPVQAFETAFVSEKPILSKHPELLITVIDYLSEAYAVNSAIDTYLSLKSGPANQYGQELVREAGNGCGIVLGILEDLSDNLQSSLAAIAPSLPRQCKAG